MMIDYLDILKTEYSAGDNSFLIKLRCYFEWDKEAFYRMTEAMKACCIDMEKEEYLPRFLCEGFYYISHFIRDFTEKGGYKKEHSEEYYQKAYRCLADFEYWFFNGRSPYMHEVSFDPLSK